MKAKQISELTGQLWLAGEPAEKYLLEFTTDEPLHYVRAYEYVRTISWDWWEIICLPTCITIISRIKTYHYSKKFLQRQNKVYISINRPTVPLRI